MTSNHELWFWIVSAAVFVGAVAWAWGYNYGKRMMLELIEDHISGGLTAQHAIEYERDVLEGRIPRG